jgi:anti-anti-sigma factor
VQDEPLTVNIIGVEPPSIALVGELDFRTTPKVTAAARTLRARDLVIDCSGLTFLDSFGVSALVMLHKDREAGGGSLVLTGLTGSPRRILEIMALLDMFEPEP